MFAALAEDVGSLPSTSIQGLALPVTVAPGHSAPSSSLCSPLHSYAQTDRQTTHASATVRGKSSLSAS